MRSVGVLLASPGERLALAAATGRARLQLASSADELLRLVEAGGLAAVVAELRDVRGASSLPALLAAQRRAPPMPVVVATTLTSAGTRDVVDAMKAGLQATWVIRGYERLESAVADAMLRSFDPGPAATIIGAVAPVLPAVAHPLLTFAAVHGARPVTVREAAGVLGVSIRTLEERLGRAGVLPPRRLLGWCRTLHAAWHLDVLGWTTKRVAAELAWSSVPALYKHLRHYGGVTPTAIREAAGFTRILRESAAVLTI